MAATIARILFLLALLGQALAAPVGGLRTHAVGGETSLCLIAHGDVGVARDNPSHKGDPAHRHGSCAFCELGAGGPPLLIQAGRIDARPARAAAAHLFRAFAVVPFSRDDSNAATRAPPSFS
jgi:hypothetical protein